MYKKIVFALILITTLSLLAFIIIVINDYEFLDSDITLEINNEDNEPALGSSEKVVEYGSNFRIIKLNADNANAIAEFRYEVFNNEGEVVMGGVGWRPPSFNIINDYILEISVSAGTGIQMVQYYLAEKDMLSEAFNTPILITNKLIGLFKWSDEYDVVLIVRDIFDTEIYYNEFLLEDFANVANPMDAIIQIEYLENIGLKITYLSGEYFNKKIAIFQIYKPS